MLNNRERYIVDFVKENGACSSKEIFEGTNISVSYATLKRILTNLKSSDYLLTKGKGTKYLLSPAYDLIQPIDIERDYQEEIDERKIQETFNSNVITDILRNYSSFTEQELERLELLQKEYQSNIAELSENEYKNELEKLAIDLSWKSSQIEGNTYSLLETERLLKEKETASGKTNEEAVML